MRIRSLVWLPDVVDKLRAKHSLRETEVEQVFRRGPLFRRVERGRVPGEDLYAALGRTDAGRYVIVFFVLKKSGDALMVTARDMDRKERRRYENE